MGYCLTIRMIRLLPRSFSIRCKEINRSRADAYNANYGACSHLPKGDNPYRERLVCADCGTQMKLYRNLSKNHKKAYFTYICPTYEEHRELRCTKKTIRSNVLDAAWC